MQLDINKVLSYYESIFNELNRKYITAVLEIDSLQKEIEEIKEANLDLARQLDKFLYKEKDE